MIAASLLLAWLPSLPVTVQGSSLDLSSPAHKPSVAAQEPGVEQAEGQNEKARSVSTAPAGAEPDSNQPTQAIGEKPIASREASPLVRTQEEWRQREEALLARVRNLELELAQEQALRFEREQEWFEFTKLLTLLPEERRPDVPEFLAPGAAKRGSVSDGENSTPEEKLAEEASRANASNERRAMRRAQEIKTTLRAYLRSEGSQAFDLMEVGLLADGGIGPIVARQLDGNGRFLATLVADRLHLEKSDSGFTVTIVLEGGYERRNGQIWPFPDVDQGGQPVAIPMDQVQGLKSQNELRAGVLRIPLPGVNPAPWIDALPELFRPEDRRRLVDDGSTNLISLRYSFNQLLEARRTGARWRLVSVGGVVAGEWRDVHMAELSLQGEVVRRLFADRAILRMEGSNAIFEMRDGAQDRAGVRAPFLAGRYTLVLPGVDGGAWRGAGIPGL